MTWISDSRPASPHAARARGLALAAACLLMIGGCTGETGAAPSESTPTTPAPVETRTSPTPTGTASQDEPSMEPSSEPIATRPPAPDPPERPAAMDGTDALAAIETAEYFLDGYTFATASGDPSIMRSVSSQSCELCSRLAEQVVERAADGGWQEGGEVTYRDPVVPVDHESSRRFPVQFEATYAAYSTRRADGALEKHVPARSMTLQVEVARTDSGWQVVGIHEAR